MKSNKNPRLAEQELDEELLGTASEGSNHDEPIVAQEYAFLMEQINEVTAFTPKLRFEMQQMVKDLEAKLERMEALHSKDHRETEIFLQNLHSEITSIHMKYKP